MRKLYQAKAEDLRPLVELALCLWPGHDFQELAGEFQAMLPREDCAIFLAAGDAEPVGFAQCQLRRDYVEGTSTSPVGYLEGIYVVPEQRKTGLARELLAACENWARSKGCQEFASDCELSNIQSLRFHLRMGFQEATRIICFRKTL